MICMNEERVYWTNNENDEYVHFSMACPHMKDVKGVSIGTIKEAIEKGHGKMCPDCISISKTQEQTEKKKKNGVVSFFLGALGGGIGFLVLSIVSYILSIVFAFLNSFYFFRVVLSWPVGGDLIAIATTNTVSILVGAMVANKIGAKKGILVFSVLCVLLIILSVYLIAIGFLPTTFNQILSVIVYSASTVFVFKMKDEDEKI